MITETGIEECILTLEAMRDHAQAFPFDDLTMRLNAYVVEDGSEVYRTKTKVTPHGIHIHTAFHGPFADLVEEFKARGMK